MSGMDDKERISETLRSTMSMSEAKATLPIPVLKPEYRDMPGDEEVAVSISMNREADGSRRVSSPAFVADGYIDTAAIPFPIQLSMASTSGKPPMVRPILVPESRIEMIEVALQLQGLDMEHADYSAQAMQWTAQTLNGADLYWVSAEMCHLLQHAAPALPPTTLTADLMPSEYGVVFFAESLVGQDAQQSNQQVWVSALAWGPCTFDVTDTTRVDGAVVLPPKGAMSKDPSAVVPPDGFNPDDYGLEPGEEFRFRGNGISISTWRKWERWMPLGRSDWPMGFDTEGTFAPPNYTDVQLASIIEDRRWAAAFAILSQQTNIARTRIIDTDRHAAKRLKRRKLSVPKIRLVDINPPKHVPSGETREVHWTKRWLVRGHWRQQACGPQRSQRRPVFVQPHVKGPEDKPLEVSPEVVKVWRR